jgi:NAD(P)-dependent dehydrogenase (short-subunit alcohol dehydrogenase family)
VHISVLYTLSIAYSRHLRGIGLETCILFAREGANVLMADISGPGLEKASAKLKQLIPSHHKVEVKVRISSFLI